MLTPDAKGHLEGGQEIVGPDEFVAFIAAQLGQLGVAARAPDGRMLEWAEIREMADAGITFGGHTVSHPILTTLTPDELWREVAGAKREIESRLSREVTLFAYPNGGPRDFDAASKRALRESGYRAAVTTIWGSNGPESEPLELRRVGTWDDSAPLSLLRLAIDRARG
jgi:peptidoglycan/xylan/chitin deacetylase (PgdA/CDA1 family)